MESLMLRLVGEDFTLVPDGSRFFRTMEHSSLVVDTKKELFYWNSRNLFGGCRDYLVKVRGMSHSDAIRYLGGQTVFSTPATNIREVDVAKVIDKTLVDLFYDVGRNHRSYWYLSRGYTDKTINEFKLGYTGEWYTIPIYENGEFTNFQVRKENPKIIKHWYKGRGPHPFNFSVLDFSSWVVITEGPPDAIMLRQNNIPAISQTGGSGYWKYEWIGKLLMKKKIYIVYDNDDAGRYNAKKLGSLLGKKATIYTFSGFDDKFDITNYFMANYTANDFMELLESEGRFEYEV